MNRLNDLEPNRVFYYFEEISRIPHGSGNTKQISDYCVEFAKMHQLKYMQDASNNVIIFKPGTAGYEASEPIIIQGHLDMVCEKEHDCSIDFETEGLELVVEGDFLSAKGTTLGGDDGIAVAYALAILESEEIEHPPLEIVFTVDEEVGMLGAADLDCSSLKGKRFLNIDSEEEGYLLVSCAGGVTATCNMPLEYATDLDADAEVWKLTVTGLQGGHSGVEIDKGRGNANQLLGRVLYALNTELGIQLISIDGGLKDNAIPRESVGVFGIVMEQETYLKELVQKLDGILQAEYRSTDKDVRLLLEKVSFKDGKDTENRKFLSKDCTKKLITALVNLPGGIQKMSSEISGLVQTSLNLGILQTKEDAVVMSFSVRSSIGTEKDEVVSRMKCLIETLGGTVTCKGDYPAWEYRKDSPLRELMVAIYEEQTGKKPVIQALHAGLECGLFAGKLEDLDCISFGPDILDIHTPAERMSISSVKRTWEYILEILKRLK